MGLVLLVLVLLSAAFMTYGEYQAGWMPVPDEGSSRTKGGVFVGFYVLNAFLASIPAIAFAILVEYVRGDDERD
jgi:hypothetical protein